MSRSSAISDETLWDAIALIFSGRAFMRADASWFAGLASRSGHDRMKRLTESKQAKRLQQLIASLGRPQLSRLVVRSAINHEQAMSALRLTLIVNLSAPVGALVLTNQFLPGSVGDLILSLPPIAVYVPLLIMLSMLIGIIWFVYAGVTAAQDLNHLLRLRLAEIDDRGEEQDDEGTDILQLITDLT